MMAQKRFLEGSICAHKDHMTENGLLLIVKVNLLEESHRNCDKISGYCQLHELHTFHGVIPPLPLPKCHSVHPPFLLGGLNLLPNFSTQKIN